MKTQVSLKRTPLFEMHEALKGKIVPFSGWEMPIQYKGVIEEHLVVRSKVGVFDVSHMGEIEIKGPQATQLLQTVMTHDLSSMADRSILYSLMCYDDGGVVDDLLIHRFSGNHYLLCVNAANTDKDFSWIETHSQAFDVEASNISDNIAQLAIQGPKSETVLQKLVDIPMSEISYYNFAQGHVSSVPATIARTGYTGEDGFEIYFSASEAKPVFEKILECGDQHGIQPIGLGARDTLRLEMGYPLYGHEIDKDTCPLEAGLGWVIKLNKKTEFIGAEALRAKKKRGLESKRVGLALKSRGVLREDFPIYLGEEKIGRVTSGTHSPSLKKGVGMGFVRKTFATVGTDLNIKIRDRMVEAEIVPLPMVPSHVKK